MRAFLFLVIAASACCLSGCATSGKTEYPDADPEAQLIQRGERVRSMSKSPYVL